MFWDFSRFFNAFTRKATMKHENLSSRSSHWPIDFSKKGKRKEKKEKRNHEDFEESFERDEGMMRNDLNIPYLRRNFANNMLLFENVPAIAATS